MRIAILSDIHGNLTALEAVLADVEQQRPDLVVHGGDFVTRGARPAEVVDAIRRLGWPVILGNIVMPPWGMTFGWCPRHRVKFACYR